MDKCQRKLERSFPLSFGNILIFHADTFHKSVLPSPWNEVLRVSISIAYLLAIIPFMTSIVARIKQLQQYLITMLLYRQLINMKDEIQSFYMQYLIGQHVMIIQDDIILIIFISVRL